MREFIIQRSCAAAEWSLVQFCFEHFPRTKSSQQYPLKVAAIAASEEMLVDMMFRVSGVGGRGGALMSVYVSS